MLRVCAPVITSPLCSVSSFPFLLSRQFLTLSAVLGFAAASGYGGGYGGGGGGGGRFHTMTLSLSTFV